MTGNRISNSIAVAAVYLGCGLAGLLPGDVITLAGKDVKLSGTVRSINQAGVVELTSDLAPEPLLLKGEAVTRIGFSQQEQAGQFAPAMVELVNGDLLPATIESLDEHKLVAISPDAGRLEIAREYLKSLQLGIQKRKVLYAGPKDAEEWTFPDKSKKWDFDQGGFSANHMARASKKLELPEQFILRFTLKWEPKQTPNFKVTFADPLLEYGKPADRYYITFNSAGFDLRRESTKGKHFAPLQWFNRMPKQYPDNKLNVELRVDRKSSRIRLFLNNEDEGVFPDPISGAPNGSGITLEGNGGGSQRIEGIEVLKYDNALSRHRAEDRGDAKNDSLISTEDDRWSGHLTGIRKSNAGPVFSFKSDFQKDTLEIPENNVSTVFFASKDDKRPPSQASPFVLQLQGDGALRVSSCQLTADRAAVVHPLIGPLNLQRAGIIGLEKSTSKTEPASEP